MDKDKPVYCKCFKKLFEDRNYWEVKIIRSWDKITYEVTHNCVSADSLITFGTHKATIEQMGWKTHEEYIKNRLKEYECIDILEKLAKRQV